MSELIQNNSNRNTTRWRLLTGVSALALTMQVATPVNAEDVDHPTVWIELGGQMEAIQGLSAPFSAPFMSVSPTPDIYKGFPFLSSQDAPHHSFGEEGKFTVRPEDSGWTFSVAVRYGRSNTSRHAHRQASAPFAYTYYKKAPAGVLANYVRNADFGDLLADTQTKNDEQHLILDFTAGKDVGVGLFGRHSLSTIEAGVRFATFTAHSSATISGNPEINAHTVSQTKYHGVFETIKAVGSFHRYALYANADRTFRGLGPTVSWNASTVLSGNDEDGELTFDWGVNGALLFGKQKAKTSHTTNEFHRNYIPAGKLTAYTTMYGVPNHSTRSRSVTIPNVGGFAGLSIKWASAKVSLGYREDFFVGAMDTGIDTHRSGNIGFSGPFATVSVGLGG